MAAGLPPGFELDAPSAAPRVEEFNSDRQLPMPAPGQSPNAFYPVSAMTAPGTAAAAPAPTSSPVALPPGFELDKPGDITLTDAELQGAPGMKFLEGFPVVGAGVPALGAAIQAAMHPISGVGAKGEHFNERYAENLKRQKAVSEKVGRESPVTSTAASLLGGAALLGPVGATSAGGTLLGLGGKTLAGQMGRMATSGAAINAVDELARGHDPTMGAVVGGVTGGLLPVGGKLLVAGARQLSPAARAAAREASANLEPAPGQVAEVVGVKVPLRKSEVTGDRPIAAEEQAFLAGGHGDEGRRLAEQHELLREQRIGQVGDNFSKGLSPTGAEVVESPQAAGGLISGSIQAKAAADKALYQQLYKDVGELPGEFPRGTFGEVGNSIRTRMSAGTNPVLVDDFTPYAKRALQDVDQNIGTEAFQNLATPKGQESPSGITLTAVDSARKRLVSIYGQAKSSGNIADARATQRVINEFDNHVVDAMDAGLFSGSDLALPTLRAARQQFAYTKNTYGPQGSGDVVGQKMQKIIGRYDGQEATPSDVANYLYGSTGANGTAATVGLAQRVRSVFGKESPEWTAVRQGIWRRISEPGEGQTAWGPQKQSERILKFLNDSGGAATDGEGKALSQVLFSNKERETMREIAGVLKQMVPLPRTTNPSGTATMLQRIMGQSRRHLLSMLGFAVHGPVGAATGYALERTGEAIARRRAVKRAQDLFYGPREKATFGQLAPPLRNPLISIDNSQGN